MQKILSLVPRLDYGSEATHIRQVTNLSDAIQFHVVTLACNPTIKLSLENQGALIHQISGRQNWNFSTLVSLRNLIAEINPDLIHAWGLPALRYLRTVDPKGRRNIILSKPFHFRPRRKTIGWFDRSLVNQVSKIVVRSRSEAELSQQMRISPQKIQVIPPGVSPPFFTGNIQIPDANPAPIILCIGPLEEHKGFSKAIWAIDIFRYVFPDSKVWFVGNGNYKSRLQYFVSTLQLDAFAEFVGTPEDLGQCLEKAAIVWAPAETESGTTAILEAMASGTPVIASGLSGIAEFLQHGKTGVLVDPSEPVDLARQTFRLLKDPDWWYRTATAGREEVHNHFTQERYLENYRNLYQSHAA